MKVLTEGYVLPVQDVSGDDAMGGTKPGAELREEDIGANSQQQSLLFNETIPTSIKTTVKRGGSVPVCQVNEMTVKECVFFKHYVFPTSTHVSQKVGQFVKLINPLSMSLLPRFRYS